MIFVFRVKNLLDSVSLLRSLDFRRGLEAFSQDLPLATLTYSSERTFSEFILFPIYYTSQNDR